MRQKEVETVDQFLTQCHLQVQRCKFRDAKETEERDTSPVKAERKCQSSSCPSSISGHDKMPETGRKRQKMQ